ncbi:MAG: prenyltransferase, partial [Candidatus Eremiobacteraeota bacterium]|nr:prenyltransferase [Candidatus Eremiobacteraeota bacterium]
MASVSDLRAFLRLTRPKFLFGGFAGFALGAAVARFDGAPLTWLAYLHGQVMVTAFHLMVHYSNDYFDRAGDAFGRRTPWSGGSGALVDGSVHSRVALVAATLSVAAGLTAAAAFSLEHRFGVAVLGVAIGVLAWAYSAPPLRLAARGWGELDGALVVAVLVPLVGYATFSPALTGHALLAALPSAAAMLVMMLCVEYPDVEADARVGKRNLVVRAGRGPARALVSLAVGGVYVATA